MPDTTVLRVADLPQNAPTVFELRPDSATCAALAAELGLIGLRKLRFAGQIAAVGSADWQLTGKLGATVVQPCVVSLSPVTTRIDTDVRRLFVAGLPEIEAEEVEMPEDDTVEPLGSVIDIGAVMAEALALALPLYPRDEAAQLQTATFAEPGTEPLSDEDARPFAGLAGLRDALKKDE
ncbi:YceD family protein [Sedimentitalea sp. HM32M-2]|uniref:YceD family protein n=1 Tax=Sedimentitalea sp. HM32M-2 TaxID=3351566 RepID=UPI00363A9B01